MRNKRIAALLTATVLAGSGMTLGVLADEKTFVYGTTGYSEEMGDAGLNLTTITPAGAACAMEWVRRFSNTMTIWKWNPGWQKAMNLQMTVP